MGRRWWSAVHFSGWSAGRTLFLRMGLVGDCGTLDGPTCSAGETCIEGVCRDEALDSRRLPPFRSELVDHVDCESGTRFVISSSGEPMPSDGSDCADDEYCQEGVCLKRLPADPPPSMSPARVGGHLQPIAGAAARARQAPRPGARSTPLVKAA